MYTSSQHDYRVMSNEIVESSSLQDKLCIIIGVLKVELTTETVLFPLDRMLGTTEMCQSCFIGLVQSKIQGNILVGQDIRHIKYKRNRTILLYGWFAQLVLLAWVRTMVVAVAIFIEDLPAFIVCF